MNKSTTKRSPNWDQDEKDLLVKLVSEKLDIIENTKLDTNTNKMKKEAWHTVLTIYNLSIKPERTIDQIQNQWRKMKYTTKRTSGDCSSSEPQQEEDSLLSRLPTQSETSEFNVVTIKHELDELLASDDGENEFLANNYEIEEITPAKRLIPNEDVESAKRIKLLELNILQKEWEITSAKTEFEKKIKLIELQMQHMNEEHSLKIKKMKQELDILKNN